MGQKLWYILIAIVVIAFIAHYFYKKPKYTHGENAPNFSAQILSGESFNLSDLKGNYVLLDFWGSWCGPCRIENPELVKLYNTYHGKKFKNAENFEIVSISIETSEKSWKKAIEQDNLNWKYHIAQLERFKSPIAQLYGVREIPTKYLLNEKNEIIAVNISIGEISKLLRNRLAD